MVKARLSRVGPRKSLRVLWTFMLALLLMCTFPILILLSLGILSIPNANYSFGLSKPNDLNSIAHNTYISQGEDDKEEQWVEVISWEPRAFLYHNFLTKEECHYLINIAKPNMEKSTVIDGETGQSVESRARTSCSTYLERGFDKIVSNIEKRIADFTFIPVEHGEEIQVLHYDVGQKFDAHYDYFGDDLHTMNGGERIATMLMYLSNVEEGGETVFPNAKGNFSSVPWWNDLSNCGKLEGLAIKPKMGDALLFWSMKPDATVDPSSFHGSCPVIKGNKWSCAKWMHVNEYKTVESRCWRGFDDRIGCRRSSRHHVHVF